MTASFDVGPYHCRPIEAGYFALDGGAMLGVVPKTLWSTKIQSDELNRIPMTVRTLLIERDERRILVDCGFGDKLSDKQRQIYKTSPHRLIRSLQEHGTSPEMVTDVILTHLHFDHAGGATKVANGKTVPTFPNATYYIQKTHLEWAGKRHIREKASYWPENFEPLFEAGQVNIVNGPTTIAFSELSVLISNGHTTGQQLPKLSANGRTFVYCGDLIPMHTHIPLLWHMAYDLQPLVILDEKEHFLDQAVRENWTLLFEHDPDVIACSVEKDAKGFRAANKTECGK